MIQALLHILGDYITQNHWMAINKTKATLTGYLACFIHCVLYSLPFLIIASPMAVCIIFISHFIIDKYRLALYVVKLKNWCFTPSGFPEGTPPFLSVWLLFIVDNFMHVILNYFSILYLK